MFNNVLRCLTSYPFRVFLAFLDLQNCNGHRLMTSSLSLHILYSLVSSFVPFSSFTPDEWEAYSSENIAKAERERKASVALRSEINGILMQTYVDLRNIFETVNNEFTKRIEESLSAKRSLEKELARVNWLCIFCILELLVNRLKFL